MSIHPELGAEVTLAPEDDHDLLYRRPDRAAIRIGCLATDASRPAYVAFDELLAKHFAILGSSGSGKSCTVALLLRALLQAGSHGHVVVLDPHAEYACAFPDLAVVVDATTLTLPVWMMDFEETAGLLVRPGPDAEAPQQILRDALLAARKRYAGDQAVTVDMPVPYRPGDLLRILDTGMGRLAKPDGAVPYLRLKARLETLLAAASIPDAEQSVEPSIAAHGRSPVVPGVVLRSCPKRNRSPAPECSRRSSSISSVGGGLRSSRSSIRLSARTTSRCRSGGSIGQRGGTR